MQYNDLNNLRPVCSPRTLQMAQPRCSVSDCYNFTSAWLTPIHVSPQDNAFFLTVILGLKCH